MNKRIQRMNSYLLIGVFSILTISSSFGESVERKLKASFDKAFEKDVVQYTEKFSPPLVIGDIEIDMLYNIEGVQTMKAYIPSMGLGEIIRTSQNLYYVKSDALASILSAPGLDKINRTIPSFEARLLETLVNSSNTDAGYISLFSYDDKFIYMVSLRILKGAKAKTIITEGVLHKIPIN